MGPLRKPSDEEKQGLLEFATGILTAAFIENEEIDEDKVHMAEALYMHLTGKPWWTFHPSIEKDAREQLSTEDIDKMFEVAKDMQENATVAKVEVPPNVKALLNQRTPPPVPPKKLNGKNVHWPSFFRHMSQHCTEAIIDGYNVGTKLVPIPPCDLFRVMGTMSASIGYECCTGDPWWMCSHETLSMATGLISAERKAEEQTRARDAHIEYLDKIGITIQELADQLRPIREDEIDPWTPEDKRSPFTPHWNNTTEGSPFTRH